MFNNIEYYKNESLKQHTTFKIGGYARFFIIPKDIDELKRVINECYLSSIPYFILGRGSNILASDNGYNGAIISLKKFNHISKRNYKNNIFISVEAGVNLFKLNQFLAENAISGLEWSYGIPGTIGGATKMNAGAFNNTFSSFLYEITLLKNNKVIKLKEFDFGYRESFLTDEIVLSVKIKLHTGNKQEVFEKMNVFLEKRKSTQPYNYPSAGSIFKRNQNIIPAKLIDEMGLKGLRIGDAMISTKHAGFIVNIEKASSDDVIKLIEIIKDLAQIKGHILNEEIIYLE